MKVLVAQSCPTLYNIVNWNLPGSSIHGILQARILVWVAIPFSRESSQPRDPTWSPSLQADSLPSEPPGKPQNQEWFHIKDFFVQFLQQEHHTLFALLFIILCL